MTILVTGGAGFVGSTLVDRLLAEGHHVEVVDDMSTGSLANLASARREGVGHLKIHQCDVRDAAFAELIVRRQPEVVYHLATGTDRTGAASPAARAAVDLIGAVQLLEGARSAGVAKVVMAGSVRSAHPAAIDGVTRQLASELGLRHRELHGTPCTVVDLPTVFGPRQRRGTEGSVVACFAERLVAGLPCVLHGSGDQTRDLLYVDDAVDALVKASTAADGLRIAVGTGVQTPIRNLHRAMAAVIGSDVEPVPGAERPGEPGAVPVDPARARMYLGWEPFTPLAEALTDTLVAAAG